MKDNARKVSLGFANQEFEQGVHICQIFNDEDERHNALLEFIANGLLTGEHTACFSDNETDASLKNSLKEKGVALDEVVESGDFLLRKTGEAYFTDGKFEPERMLEMLKDFYTNSQHQNKTGARVIGEMTPEIENMEGGSRLMEYESKVSMLVRDYPLNAVCQYDARTFDGSTILDVLKVHPYMIVRGAVVRNPFYITPEAFLSECSNC